jgi:hypothetical protein
LHSRLFVSSLLHKAYPRAKAMKEGDIFHGFWYILLDRVEAAVELVEAVLAAVGLKQLGAGGVCPQAPRDEMKISPKAPRPGLRWPGTHQWRAAP